MKLLLLPLIGLQVQAVGQQYAATFYDDCHFTGSSVHLPPGEYSAENLARLGMDNIISSMQVFNGYRVTVYDENSPGGEELVATQSEPCLAGQGWNDRISSIRIEPYEVDRSGNPIFPGWYADPEGAIFGDTYWVYPTYSRPSGEQVFMDAFSSKDLVTWTKHEKVLNRLHIPWARFSMWAPSITEKDGRYYLFFSANAIQSNNDEGGIGVAVSDRPEGPFLDHIGRPLIDSFFGDAQPIDQYVFQDVDGQYYMYWGGHGRCIVSRLNDNFDGLVPYPDGTLHRDITPQGYTEGSFMLVRDGKYYLMWSEGNWTGPNYSVAYAIADNPLGPFERKGRILQQDANIARGAGHHSVIQLPGEDTYYILYHRRPLEETDGNSREVCIERMYFEDNGDIRPVQLTNEGVPAQPIAFDDTTGGAAGGLLGEYFRGKNLDTFVLSRVDQQIDFNWAEGSPDNRLPTDSFSVRWTGTLTPRYSDTYTFYLNSDNGRRLWVNGQPIVDAWLDNWDIEYSGTIQLEAGTEYTIRLEYFEAWGGANCRLEWASEQQAREVVPTARLDPRPGSDAVSTRVQPEEIRMAIFPNPTADGLRVQFAGGSAVATQATVRIIDTTGKTVSTHLLRSGERIDVSTLPRGLYLLDLRVGQGSASRKFLKQ